MSFTPFARYRNFTLANLKALLEVYPDMARSIPWEEAKDFAEANLKGYKRTAYQQACQLGLEDRTKDSFRIHNYLYTFDDENLTKYLVFWFKTYFAPNPHVKSSDEAFLLYCRLCEDILQSESHSVNFEDFVEKNIGGKSDDILLNAIKAYAAPVKYRKVGNYDNLYISESDINAIEDEVSFIKANFPIGNQKSEHNFFERFSYANFCKFYGKDENPEVKDGEEIRLADTSRVELHFEQSKECARQLVDCVYRIDNFERFSKVLKNNDKNGKIITDFFKRAPTDRSIRGLKGQYKNDKESALKLADEIIKNTYRTLLTRGQKGCYIYCTNKELNEYLKLKLKRGKENVRKS